jgi:alkanesulfonate monooxygenase SsuD/methylene tetrahydromethanopterin reductase-like flavin-dependent oxidoreductase (luciferase family)
VVLGAGLGDVGDHVGRDASFTHFGEETDAVKRARMLDEALDVIAGLWSGEPFSHRGEHFTIEEVTFVPTPIQRPRIPIWIGGGYPRRGPLARALRWDGSMLYPTKARELGSDDVRAMRAGAGERAFDITVGVLRNEDPEAERVRLRRLAEAGATWTAEYVPASEADAMRRAVDRGPIRI